jgi:hypothetical protein
MPLIHFKERFASAVANGTKRQTIRKARKRPIKPGDRLILGTWTGLPYRSKVRRLGDAPCTETYDILICEHGTVYVNGRKLGWLRRFSFAAADGFASVDDMIAWFKEVHGLPFHGVVIRW